MLHALMPLQDHGMQLVGEEGGSEDEEVFALKTSKRAPGAGGRAWGFQGLEPSQNLRTPHKASERPPGAGCTGARFSATCPCSMPRFYGAAERRIGCRGRHRYALCAILHGL